jgi:hypothetical protein
MAQKPSNPKLESESSSEVDAQRADLNTAPRVEFVDMDTGEEADFPEDYPDYYDSKGFIDQESLSLHNKREDTRGRLAIIYTVATFIMFGLGFLVSVLDAFWRQVSIIDNLATVLPLLSGIFLGSLGFVLGYYFRKLDED